MSELPLVSIIIPHQAGAEVLVQCLESVMRDASYPAFEVLVVDNGSSDGSVDEARRRFPDVRVLRLDANQGYAGGCNRGIEVSRGKYVVLLNDDTSLEPGWLRELVRAAEEDPSVAACQPKIRSLVDRGRFEYSGAAGGLMDIYAYPFSRGRLMGHVEEDRGQYDDPIEIFWASGVCMLVRRAALEDAGLFDEVFFAYMEEIDLCWRLQLQGFRIVYVPGAIVYHIGGYSLDQRVLKRMYLNHRNSMITLMKNYAARSLLWILPVKILLEIFIGVGALVRNPRRSRAVVMSFAWLLGHLPTVWRSRADVQGRRRVPDRAIFDRLYHGMAPLWYFVFGIRRVPDLPDIDRVLHRPCRADAKPAAGARVRPQARDFLDAYLDQAPTAVALMRAADCEQLARLDYLRPILEVGCGDGVFSRVLFNGVVVDAGVDADPRHVELARRTRGYAEVARAGPEALPFGPGAVSTAFAHRPLGGPGEAGPALAEIHRVLAAGGRLYLAVSGARFREAPLWGPLLERLGLGILARGYAERVRDWLGVAPPAEEEAWSEALRAAGFELERGVSYRSRRAERLRDLFLPPCGLTAPLRRALGRRLLLPRLHRVVVRAYRRRLRSAYEDAADPGAGRLLVARRAAGRPGGEPDAPPVRRGAGG